MTKKLGVIAVFDARAFVLPEAEVCNYFLWRQRDCMRNSVQAFARYHLGHSEIQGLSTSEVITQLNYRGHSYDGEVPLLWKRGFGLENYAATAITDLPVFSEDREFIERFLAVEEE